MADLASQYPSTPSFNAVQFTVNTPALATSTFSGKTRRTAYGHQFYEWEVRYPPMVNTQAGIVQGFLAQTYGPSLSFEIILPEISYSKSATPPSTTPATTAAYSKGVKTVGLDNCGANKDVLYIGDYFKFNNHSKVYQCTNTCTSNGAGIATLFFAGSLVEDVPNDTDLTVTAVPFTAIATTDAQQFDVGVGGITQISVSMKEVW